MTFFSSLVFYRGQEKLDKNFMWLKKLILLKFHEEAAIVPALSEKLRYCKSENSDRTSYSKQTSHFHLL